MFQTTNQTNYEAKWTMIFWWSNVLCLEKKTYQTYLDGEFGDFPFLLNGMSLENHLRIMENGDIIIGMGMGWE